MFLLGWRLKETEKKKNTAGIQNYRSDTGTPGCRRATSPKQELHVKIIFFIKKKNKDFQINYSFFLLTFLSQQSQKG